MKSIQNKAYPFQFFKHTPQTIEQIYEDALLIEFNKLINFNSYKQTIVLFIIGNKRIQLCNKSTEILTLFKKNKIPFTTVNLLKYPNLTHHLETFHKTDSLPFLYHVNDNNSVYFVGGYHTILSILNNNQIKK